MAAPNTDNYAHGVFLGQKKSSIGSETDPELATEGEFQQGDKDDPDGHTDTEALGARHRRRFGYTAEGAEENDLDIANKGRKPLSIHMYKQDAPQSRIANFSHGMTTHHITSVQKRTRPSTI